MMPLQNQQNHFNELNEIIQERYKEIEENKCTILHVLSEPNSKSNVLTGQHLGYDVGVCESEKIIYSSIFNEILFGNLPELIN